MNETSLLNWTLQQALTVVIIMTRVGPLLFLMPVTGSRRVPTQVKVLFTLMTSLVMAPVVPVAIDALPDTVLGYTLFVASEVAFGGILAIFTRFIFGAVETVGQMVGIQMGIGVAGTMDPEFGNQISLIGQFWGLLAILFFLSVNGHHLFMQTLVESFQWIAPGQMHLSEATFRGMMQGSAHMFVLAVKIMAPAGAALFFSHVAMGVIAKTVPQIPILIVALPLNIAVGLIFIGLSLGYFMPLMLKNFDMLSRVLSKLAMGMGV